MASAPKREYRVSWKREGKPRKRRLYQTHAAAEAFLKLLRTSSPDEFPDAEAWTDSEQVRWERMTAPFDEEPTLESRDVGEWS